jgi:hypothetical protein
MSDGLSIDLDYKQFARRLRLYDKKTQEVSRGRMTDNARDLERKAKELCPVDEGQLIDTLVSEVRSYPTLIEGRVSANMPYAVIMHEAMKPAIPAVGKQFQPGDTTRAKPGNEFGPAGGKYLERPLKGKFKQYFQHIASGIAGIR